MLREITLASISLTENSFELQIHFFTVLCIILIFLITYLFSTSTITFFTKGRVEIEKAELGLGGGSITIRPNNRDRQIAYSIWVELSTRKIGLPINLKDDVITEIYNSWYEFFKITRELIKDVPVTQIKAESTKAIINLSIELLNDGLRPHLGKWQARFRHWYDAEMAMDPRDIEPQGVQKKYPHFEELESDLMIVNAHLVNYRAKMYDLLKS